VQPFVSSVVLEPGHRRTPSEIFGSLSANGRVFLIIRTACCFAPGAQLDVGGLVASDDEHQGRRLLAGHYVFAGGQHSGFQRGQQRQHQDRRRRLRGAGRRYVKNTGVIQARLGQVVLASGAATTLELGNSAWSASRWTRPRWRRRPCGQCRDDHRDGGRVIMTAKTAHDLVGSAVNNSRA